jgi:hypothetical protein
VCIKVIKEYLEVFEVSAMFKWFPLAAGFQDHGLARRDKRGYAVQHSAVGILWTF